MKLLVLTQTVDSDDRVLGFFVRWIEELASRFESVEVICLKEGKHTLPANVQVHALGKPASRFRYVWNFYKYLFSLEYDAVFVHMNEEYVLLGGLFWFLGGKKVFLWRNHAKGSWLTHLAGLLSTKVLYTSPHSFTARFTNALQMPVGIDTDFFKSDPLISRKQDSILFLGRLDPVKKVEKFVDALTGVATSFHADIYGNPTEAGSAYARQIAVQAHQLIQKGILSMHPGVPYERTRELYQSHAIYVNLTPSGSFDKTIGEAAAAGCVVVCANKAMERVVSPALMVRDDDSKDIVRGIIAALGLSQQERAAEVHRLRVFIEEQHSLRKLVDSLEDALV